METLMDVCSFLKKMENYYEMRYDAESYMCIYWFLIDHKNNLDLIYNRIIATFSSSYGFLPDERHFNKILISEEV